jgi:Starch-binding associating with outer membrane
MHDMKHLFIKFLTVVGLTAAMTGCTKDFDEVNQNPNAPTAVNSGLLLPQIERDVINSVMGEAWGIGNIVIQHNAKNQFVNEDRYLWGEMNGIWNAVYDNMRDVNNIVTQSEANGENNYKGIALVLRCWMFSLATDLYGDVPYSEAISAKEGQNYPKYDAQEDIYNGILAELELANDLLGSTSEVVAGDIIYGGDVTKWKKLANSLRVRSLMRISRKRDVGADLREIMADPGKYPLFEGNNDNGVYTYLPTSPDQFPLYSSRIGSFNEFRASKTLMDTLKSIDDARMPIIFRPTPDTENSDTLDYVGIPNGMNDVDALQYNGGPQFQSRIGIIYYEESITPEGLKVAKGIIMTYAELQFLLAEAAEKGLITGDSEVFYENGVTASFNYFGLDVSDGYFSQPETEFTGTQQEKLNKIGLQKWISLYYNGMEAWFDWRRTGIPYLKPAISNQNGDRIPVRFYYPISEEKLNGDSYKEAINRQGPNDINTKMWHLQ